MPAPRHLGPLPADYGKGSTPRFGIKPPRHRNNDAPEHPYDAAARRAQTLAAEHAALGLPMPVSASAHLNAYENRRTR